MGKQSKNRTAYRVFNCYTNACEHYSNLKLVSKATGINIHTLYSNFGRRGEDFYLGHPWTVRKIEVKTTLEPDTR